MKIGRDLEGAKPARFYVYKLLDPSTGSAFYVGKGTGNRAWQHEANVRTGCCRSNLRKTEKIQEIIGRGQNVEVFIVEHYEDEVDAYEHEIELISADPTLTNIMPGGGPVLTPGQIKLQQEARAARLREKAERRRKIAVLATKKRNDRFQDVRGAHLHAAEVQAWLDGLPPVHVSGKDPLKLSGHVTKQKGKRRPSKLWLPDGERHAHHCYGMK